MSFDDALRSVLAVEGGTSNDPDDAGGLTHAGITHATAVAACARGLVSTDDPRLMTDAEIKTIYRVYYWDRVTFPEMKDIHAAILFDDAVNCGVGTAVKHLQRAMNRLLRVPVAEDGMSGPATKAAYRKIITMPQLESPDLNDDFLSRSLAALLVCERAEHYSAITDGVASTSDRRKQEVANRKFLRGWFGRIRKWF